MRIALGRGGGANYNPHYRYEPDWDERPRRFGTSGIEFVHITAAMTALTVVLWLVFRQNRGFSDLHDKLGDTGIAVAAFLISFFGFVLHELAHKFTAQHFGHWSEFRANWILLGLALALAYLPPHLPIAAPGATWHTAQDRREQGKISAMGPLLNCAVAVAALWFTFGEIDTVAEQLAATVVFFSGFLATFNLIPLGPLDGRKVIAWNPLVWGAMVALSVALVVQGAKALEFTA